MQLNFLRLQWHQDCLKKTTLPHKFSRMTKWNIHNWVSQRDHNSNLFSEPFQCRKCHSSILLMTALFPLWLSYFWFNRCIYKMSGKWTMKIYHIIHLPLCFTWIRNSSVIYDNVVLIDCFIGVFFVFRVSAILFYWKGWHLRFLLNESSFWAFGGSATIKRVFSRFLIDSAIY